MIPMKLRFKSNLLSIIFSSLLVAQVYAQDIDNQQANRIEWLEKSVSVAERQLLLASGFYTPGENPRSIWPNGKTRIAPPKDWTSGFFPGSLWLIYEITKESYFKSKAEKFTEALDSVPYYTHTHDLGFMLYCSYGNGYRLTDNANYRDALLKGAASLAGRYSSTVGCIRSWDFGTYKFPVIVDNMMNLELLTWAFKQSGNEEFIEIATSHANTTMANHFRTNNSSYHVVDYDPETETVFKKMTHQGYSDESSWARGQAWGLYGYTMMFKETGEKDYLEQAKAIASFIMNHPTLPEDGIPFWDFDSRYIPNDYRDVSAAAIMASALLDLSVLANERRYLDMAERVLQSLSGDGYLNTAGTKNYFILDHSVGNLQGFSEIDTPINYADYYFLEALIRYAKIKGIDLSKL